MANFCHSCAAPVTPDMKACPECGTWLRAASAVPSAPPASAGASPRLHAAADPRPRLAPAGYEPGLTTRTLGDDWPAERETTVVGAPVAYSAAPGGRRFVAMLIDSVYPLMFMLPGGLLLAVGATVDSATVSGLGGMLLAGAVAYALYYQFTKDGRPGGASIGKRLMRLMVVHLPSNAPCTRGQSALRALVLMLLNVVPLVGWLIEPVVVLAAEDGRRLGDRAAETQVIDVVDWEPESTPLL